MRPLQVSLLTALLLAGSLPAMAEVRLIIRKDGTKFLTNSGSFPARKGKGAGSTSDLSWLAKRRDRKSDYDAIIERHSARYGVDPILVRAVIQVESNFNPKSVSHKGARGLMQLMPGTAKRFGVRKIDDPDENIRGGIQYLAVLQKLFPNDLSRALAAYNAGENAVIRYGRVPPYEETQTYVRRCLTVYHGRPYGSVTIAPLRGGKLQGKLAARPRVSTTSRGAKPAFSTAARSVAVIR